MADPFTWVALAATAVSAGGQISAGKSAEKAANANAALQRQQGKLANEEAQVQASKTEEEARKFRDRQILAYLKNGVTLNGSPLLVLDETIKKGDEEAAAIRKRGYATENLANQEASITSRMGRAQFISGITGAAGTLGSGYMMGRSAGLYGNTKVKATGTGL